MVTYCSADVKIGPVELFEAPWQLQFKVVPLLLKPVEIAGRLVGIRVVPCLWRPMDLVLGRFVAHDVHWKFSELELAVGSMGSSSKSGAWCSYLYLLFKNLETNCVVYESRISWDLGTTPVLTKLPPAK